MIKNDKSIREEANIVAIIGEYVTLKRQGSSHVGLCPFHAENSPSFHVDATRNRFKCFGCGEGGDAIHFLMEHQKMTYPEAIEAAATHSRIEVEYANRELRQQDIDAAKAEQARRTGLSETLTTVHRFLADKYPLGTANHCDIASREEVLDADGRTLRESTAETFGICFSPDENIVTRSGFWEDAKLTEIGIVAQGDHGHYDFFRNRMIFRIRDHQGKTVGLGGRRRRADDAEGGKRAKFLNPKASILYDKSNVLFGLFENRKGIREAESAMLVEGYMDVVTPHDHGVCNLVAPCGTALTEAQARLLERYTKKVTIVRDNDPAGLDAAKRDVEILVAAGLQVSICLLGAPEKLKADIEEQRDLLAEKKAQAYAKQAGAAQKIMADIEEQKGWIAAKTAQVEGFRSEGLDEKTIGREERLLKAMAEKLADLEKKLDKLLERADPNLTAMEEKLADLERERAGFDSVKDPDDFCRKHGGAGFRFFVETNAQDAIIWRVMAEVSNREDVYQRDAATNVAGQLLSLIESQSLRDYYIRDLCKKGNLGAVKSLLGETIDTYQKNKGEKSKLTPKQQQDIIKYGLYEQNNRYHICTDLSGTGWCCSNFVVRPIIFIEGVKQSIRLVEVRNEHGESRILDIDAKNFVELGPFKATVEGRGNFDFQGKAEHYQKVKRKVYDEMKTAFPIQTLGLHREGFFAFANGIVHEGRFYEVNEYGLVSFGDTRYYLPAFSKLTDHIKSDDVDNDYEDEKFHPFTPGDPGITFEEWTRLMAEVHGTNGVVGVLFYCMTFVRGELRKRLDEMFPILNLFGLPKSGKNQLGASLISLFGIKRPPVNVFNATDASFFRRIAQVRNGFAWYDEYLNSVDPKRVQSLKQFADGAGRTRANYDSSNRTNTSGVVSACILSGQHQPTADPALFSRCICLNFSITERTDAERERHTRLKGIENTGKLVAFTAMLHSHRPHMIDQLDDCFDRAMDVLKPVARGNGVGDRELRNYAAMFCAFLLLKDKVAFGFSEAEVVKILSKGLLDQVQSSNSENEVSVWWRIIEFFISNGEIEHGHDLIVEAQNDEVFDIDWTGKNKETKVYQPTKRLLYLNFTRSHQFYMERHQRQRNAKGLDIEALKHYLRASPGYEGFKRSKKFNGIVKMCYVFDTEKLPFDLEDTLIVLARKRRAQPGQEPTTDELTPTVEVPFVPDQSPVNVDLPF